MAVDHLLLDIDLGGQQWSFATSEVSPISRARNGPVLYRSGLSGIDFTFGTEEVSVSVRAAEASTWAEERRSLGPIRGRPFILRRWTEGQVLEDATVLLQGTVTAASWASSDDPHALDLTLGRSLRSLALEVIHPQAKADSDTWPVAGIDEKIYGAAYNLCIGHPGRQRTNSDTANTAATVPALLVTQFKWVFAGHRVEAKQVQLWDMSASPVTVETVPVSHMEDFLDRVVAYIDSGDVVTVPTRGHEYYVGMSPMTGWGGGLQHRGRLVQGLGDLLIFGAHERSRAVYDVAEMEARRAGLNRWQIDCVLNELGVNWDDWLTEVLELFGVEPVHGPRGIYYREVPYETDPLQVRGRLVAGLAGGGHRVERTSSVSETDEEIANIVTVDYAPYSGGYGRRVTYSYKHSEYGPGSGVDTRSYADVRCSHSRLLYGDAPLSIQADVVHEPSTAALLARKAASRYALPAQVATYIGGRDLLAYNIYDTVRLWDETAGALFQDDLALITEMTILESGAVSVTVRVPADPMRVVQPL